MHEFGIAEAILDAVERRAAGRPVVGVTVRIGRRHSAAEPALVQSFDLVAAGGVADGATLEVVTVDGDELTLESIRLDGPRSAWTVGPASCLDDARTVEPTE